MRRGLPCSGFPSLVFLNENETARRNSRRARGEAHHVVPVELQLVPALTQQQSGCVQEQTRVDPELHRHYFWLNERAASTLPEPLKRDLETRAIENLFTNWMLYPRNDGMTPGHMHALPKLYYNAGPGSILWFAVRAVAFADMRDRHDSSGVSFSVKARMCYGGALEGIRAVTANSQALMDDRVLMALLLIDSFEVRDSTVI